MLPACWHGRAGNRSLPGTFLLGAVAHAFADFTYYIGIVFQTVSDALSDELWNASDTLEYRQLGIVLLTKMEACLSASACDAQPSQSPPRFHEVQVLPSHTWCTATVAMSDSKQSSLQAQAEQRRVRSQ